MSVHQRNLQLLLIEIYKIVNNLNPSVIAKVFVTNDVPNNLHGSTNFVLPKARTNLYGIVTVRFDVQKLWQTQPKKSKSPKHCRFLKEILKPNLLIAATNYAKVLL